MLIMIINGKYDSWFGVKIVVNPFTPDNLAVRFKPDIIAVGQLLWERIYNCEKGELEEALKGVMLFNLFEPDHFSRLTPALKERKFLMLAEELKNG